MAIIEKLHVLKFRNLTDQYLQPNNNINLIIGQNGQGKTNFIESIYYLGHSRSFKTKNLKDIIPFDEQQIKITALVDKQKVSIKKSRDKSQILIDEEKISSNSLLSQILPIQIISPDRGFVVGGSPKLKRSYLDWGVFHNRSNETLKAYKTNKKTLKKGKSIYLLKSNCVKFLNCKIRSFISFLSRFNIRSVPNFSTQNEAKAEPYMTAFFKLSKLKSSVCARNPAKPPAKVSPAPVGSNTAFKGNAGA